jgi:hypothetical protein
MSTILEAAAAAVALALAATSGVVDTKTDRSGEVNRTNCTEFVVKDNRAVCKDFYPEFWAKNNKNSD